MLKRRHRENQLPSEDTNSKICQINKIFHDYYKMEGNSLLNFSNRRMRVHSQNLMMPVLKVFFNLKILWTKYGVKIELLTWWSLYRNDAGYFQEETDDHAQINWRATD